MAVNPKHDRQGVRRASEIEQKYNLSLLENFGKDDSRYKEEMSKFEQEFTQYKVTTDGKIELLATYVQGMIEDLTANENATDDHINDTNNPHKVDKEDVGLGNVDNTADSQKNVKYAENSGSSTKATQDAEGNVITSTYAKASDLKTANENINKNTSAIEEIRKSSGNLKITYDASTEAITLTMV